MEIQHDYAELSEVKLHYALCGEGDLIIFLHGFPEFWYEWKHQLPFFGKNYLAVAPDMRGYNLSSRPASVASYQPEHLALDVAELTRHLGREKCSVVAHDWGGLAACMFAHYYPEMLDRLILINAPNPTQWMTGFLTVDEQIQSSQYVRVFRSAEAEGLFSADGYEPFFTNVFQDAKGDPIFSDEEKEKYLEAWSREGGLTGGLNFYRALPVEPPEAGTEAPADSLSKVPSFMVKAPTHVIWGNKDSALNESLLDLCPQVFPPLDVKFIDGASHWVVHEQPEVVNRLIAEFLD